MQGLELAYQAGVRLPAFGSSPKYLSELNSYLYVGGKFKVPSDHPSKARPFFSSLTNWNKMLKALQYLTEKTDKRIYIYIYILLLRSEKGHHERIKRNYYTSIILFSGPMIACKQCRHAHKKILGINHKKNGIRLSTY